MGNGNIWRCASWLLMLFLPVLAQAQQLIRCGSTYQDRPCNSEQIGKTLSRSAASITPPQQTTDRECTMRGEQAKKIMWGREVGHTSEMQLAAATSQFEKTLITEVYGLRGNSNEVRAAVEATCLTAKQRALQAAALIEAAGALKGQPPGAATAPGASGQSSEASGAKVVQPEQSAASATKKSASNVRECELLLERIESIQKSLQTGGTVSLMEILNRRKHEVEEAISRAGC